MTCKSHMDLNSTFGHGLDMLSSGWSVGAVDVNERRLCSSCCQARAHEADEAHWCQVKIVRAPSSNCFPPEREKKRRENREDQIDLGGRSDEGNTSLIGLNITATSGREDTLSGCTPSSGTGECFTRL
ncbi:hypothetical protein F2P81_004933 [Scophthalmus maximus]|uniref:Uncharacterized protein n=1 Tax=Scophthalmus maximus TaxID=52904 RepID=A0A6A4T7S5_SCOMX|nr:hypothetical protein F2P81_004933 [Scophthalmus maximus]